MSPSNIITLTTDFGLIDTYVGVMKGVILSINPACAIVDITHHIDPQNIIDGIFALSTSYGFFPKGTIHVAVVDPGVGSLRRPLLVVTEDYYFIGPDNGIFSFIFSAGKADKVFEIKEPSFLLKPISGTFHGRDIFSPAAAHLSNGTPPESFGPPIKDYNAINIPVPALINTNEAEGRIIHVDRFGNLITNITRLFVEKNFAGCAFHAEIMGAYVSRILPNYASGNEGEIFCLVGSSDFLEVVCKNSSAKERTGAGIGSIIKIYNN